jgi:hypothetical protein
MAASIPVLTIDTLLALFAEPPRVSNPPSFEEIQELKQVIHNNGTKVRSLNGGANHGHLGITMTAADYANRSPIPWTNPAAPPPNLHVPPGTNGLAERNMREDYKHQCNIFFLQDNVNRALKKQIESAVPTEFLDEIRDQWVNLDNVTIPAIFAHLMEQPSGDVSPEDVRARSESIESQKYNLAEELTIYFKRLVDYQKYAAQGNMDISDNNLIQIGIRHIRATGHFNLACNAWIERIKNIPGDNTWNNFKRHFQAARRVVQQDVTATNNNQYQAANQLIAQQNSKFAEIEQTNQRNFEHLTTQMNNMIQAPSQPPPAPFHDHTAYHANGYAPPAPYPPQYYPPPQQPHHQYMYNTTNEQALLQQLADLKRKLHAKENRSHGGGRKPKRAKTERRWNNSNYCWTHGHDVHVSHTSATCKKRADNHQPAATRSNPMGGSQTDHHLVN